MQPPVMMAYTLLFAKQRNIVARADSFTLLGDSNTKLSDEVNAALHDTDCDSHISAPKSPIYCKHFILRNIKQSF